MRIPERGEPGVGVVFRDQVSLCGRPFKERPRHAPMVFPLKAINGSLKLKRSKTYDQANYEHIQNPTMPNTVRAMHWNPRFRTKVAGHWFRLSRSRSE
jgi:hypothetical protein